MEQTQTSSAPVGIALFPVDSARILAAGYDPVSRTLAMQFKDSASRTYRYQDVPEEVWNGFTAAKSKGSYFYASIFEKFGYERIEADGEVSKIAYATSVQPDAGLPEAA